MVLLLGESINGSKAWLKIGFLTLQPSELMRLSLALYLIHYSDEYDFYSKSQLKFLLAITILTLVPILLVFLEPDTGAIVFYVIIFLSIIWQSPIHKKWFYIIILFMIILISTIFYFYFYNQDILIKLVGSTFFYRMDRLINFKNAIGYQMENALITISNASLLGTGLNNILIYIPEGHTDFMLAFSFGNFGILSGIIILLSYLVMDVYLIKKSKSVKDFQTTKLINTFIALFFFQQLYNILMNINLMPIMGIPLPFLSYGGSTIIIYFIFLGIILNDY